MSIPPINYNKKTEGKSLKSGYGDAFMIKTPQSCEFQTPAGV